MTCPAKESLPFYDTSKTMEKPQQWMRIPIVTGINAGKGVPDDYTDWIITGFRDVRLIESSDKAERFIGVPVEGDSLNGRMIADGDLLVCRVTRAYEPGELGVWQTPSGRTAKFAYNDGDGFIVLHNAADWEQRWAEGEIRLLGLVVRVERDVMRL